MKKFICILLLIALLLTCCACGKQQTEEAPAATLALDSPEAMYGHIDQTVPVDGVYKIWSAEGVKNMANHPDATFELLCNVDMQGAEIAPIGEFTGQIKGGNFTVSNFTLKGEGESFGFVAINRGNIHNLLLEGVTFVPGSGAKNIGTLAGVNEGTILRCTVSGTMDADAAADGACGSLVGTNSGSIANTVANVDLSCTASGSANVGGIAGTVTGGDIQFVDTNGKLDITGQDATVGLFAGQSSNTVFTNCAFVGASNTQDGKLFTNFTGNDDDEKNCIVNGLWRDNVKALLTEGQQKLRDRVVEEMYAMGSVEWHPTEDLRHSCTCQLSSCHGIYAKSYTYYGIPYNHKGGSLSRFNYCIDGNGYVKDFVYEMADFDGYDAYIGNDCSTAVIHAWWTVSNSTDFIRTSYMLPSYGKGTLPVGNYNYDVGMNTTLMTDTVINANDEQTMYEAYGQLRKGDAYVYVIEAGGHTRMCAEDAVVVRNQDGIIDPEYSYVVCHEQGAPTTDEETLTSSSWRLNFKYTFANLYHTWACPVTMEELVTGEMEVPECTLEGSLEGKLGMTTGTVKANYFLDSVTLKITDDAGNVVLDHQMFTSVGRWSDHNYNDSIIRNYVDSYDLGNLAAPLQSAGLEPGKTYHYTISAELATDDVFTLKEGSFINGN